MYRCDKINEWYGKDYVGNVSEIPEGKMTHVVAGDKDFLLANVQESRS